MDHVSGAENAGLTIVKYGCYQCPYSGQAHRLIRTIQQRLGQHVRLVFRHFPQIDLHPQAQKAAEVAEAAAAQGKFWQMHNLLFERQQALSDGCLVEYAAELGLEMSHFLKDVSGHVYEQRVQADLFSGIRMGVTCTPTLFINGIRQNGDDSLLQLLTVVIDACDPPLNKARTDTLPIFPE
ncbi:MAG: thioredoxin domain-containing protein [Cyanobacteria bacterium P01_F01_bin.13]